MTDLHPRNARLLERIRAVEAEHGRLPMPDMAGWDIFPFEGDIRVRLVDDPVVPEPPRSGEGGETVPRLRRRGRRAAIWADERWKLAAAEADAVPDPAARAARAPRLDRPRRGPWPRRWAAHRAHRARAAWRSAASGRVHVMKIGRRQRPPAPVVLRPARGAAAGARLVAVGLERRAPGHAPRRVARPAAGDRGRAGADGGRALV